MKNLENYGVDEMSELSKRKTNGGSWLGYVIGSFLGATLRYSGVYGTATISTDMAVYFGKK